MATEKNEDRRFYKIWQGSDRGQAILKFKELATKSAQKSSDLAKELGAKSYSESPTAVYPGVGIGSLIFNKKPSNRKYTTIGRKRNLFECVPNASSAEGKRVLRKIWELKVVGAAELRKAFDIPEGVEVAPVWFLCEGDFYLSCRYELPAEYEPISEGLYKSMEAIFISRGNIK